MKLRSIVLIICTLAIAGLIGLAIFINQRESVVVDGSIKLPGLQHSAQIYFDKAYVPYIQARSEKDLIIAQGFITASQRLFQMDILRRLSKGEMAAIFGSSCMGSDRLARILGFKRLADQEYIGLSLETKKWLRGYSQGINAYIAQNSEKLPLEFILLGYQPQSWRAEDTLAILRYLQYANDECWQLNILQDSIREKVGAKLTQQMFGQWAGRSHLPQTSFAPNAEKVMLHLSEIASRLPPPAELAWGSNGWVVSKRLSQSGSSILACDKHTLAIFPDLFFACSLRAPFIHVAGLTIPGVPGILIGRNDDISWAPISLKGCWQYLNIEKFSDKDPDQYMGPQGWLKADEIEEDIAQRFSTSRVEKVFVTRHGPLLTKSDQTAVALSWYGFNPRNNVIDSIWPLNKAKSWTEFQAALRNYKGSPQTFLYADNAGNIGKQIAGHLPLANSSNQGPDGQGQQYYIVANEDSALTLGAPADLGLLGTNCAASRASNILRSHQKAATAITLEDMIALQGDTKASLSELVVRALGNALRATQNQDKFQQEAYTALANWDGQLRANSACASIYESFLSELTREILETKLGRQLSEDYINKWPRWTQFAKWAIENQPEQLLPPAEHSFAGFLLNCFSQSLKNLRFAFNVNQLHMDILGCQWQRLHQLDFQSNINKFIPATITSVVGAFLPDSIGIGGDQDCLNACNNILAPKSFKYICNSGPTARLLIDMADNDKFYQALTFGQSGHLFSKDRIDETKKELNLWRNIEFHAIAFSEKELENLVRHSITLSDESE